MRQKPAKEEENSSLISDKDKKIQEVKTQISLLQYELINLLSEKEEQEGTTKIPLEIFSSELGALEALVKYLRENLGLEYKLIKKISGRSIGALGKTYSSAASKQKYEFLIKIPNFNIDIDILFAQKFTVLENLVLHLKDKSGMRFSQIAKMLNRDPRTIWTVYTRAKKKK